MTSSTSLTCYLVSKDESEEIRREISKKHIANLPAGDTLIRVGWSSLNYKDALAATGHPGVARRLPHVPGIDAAGIVVESASPELEVGDEVVVTGYELGAERWGGWAEYIRVPADWVIPLPTGLSLQSAMTYGTAGFTVAQCVLELQQHDVRPESGEVLVTGASGGVGSLAVSLLSQLGYQVVASTGKQQRRDWLVQLGASRVVDREETIDESKRTLLPCRWAGAVDTVGGTTLSTVLRATHVGGCVAACGMVAGAKLPSLTVYPFILRGVTLAGVTSALCPRQRRLEIWQRLSDQWKITNLDTIAQVVGLDDVDGYVDQILRGDVGGRIVVKVQEL